MEIIFVLVIAIPVVVTFAGRVGREDEDERKF